MWIFGELSYLLTTVTVKLSIAVFLSRLAKQRGYRVIVWATAIFSSIAGLVFVFVVILQCSPIPFYWDKSLQGVCKDRDTFTLGSYINATLSAMTNVVYALISIFIVWNIEMDMRGKVSGGCILLTLGSLSVFLNLIWFFLANQLVLRVCVASLTRVKFVDELSAGSNNSCMYSYSLSFSCLPTHHRNSRSFRYWNPQPARGWVDHCGGVACNVQPSSIRSW